jgi:hypothetical protein
MRYEDLLQPWRPFEAGKPNTDANMDIPLMEGLDNQVLSPTVQEILDTSDEEFGPAMTLEEARAWLSKI